jgi:amino acid transporter
MAPALIGVALIILLIASNAAADEEEERRSGAEGHQPETRSWWRELRVMGGYVLLLPLGVVFALPEVLTLGGPPWWWVWLGCAVVYVVFVVVAEHPKG